VPDISRLRDTNFPHWLALGGLAKYGSVNVGPHSDGPASSIPYKCKMTFLMGILTNTGSSQNRASPGTCPEYYYGSIVPCVPKITLGFLLDIFFDTD
jgi:hypothetical protein